MSDFKFECKENKLYTEDKNTCPVCGEFCFEEKGSYEICRVCGWEDDPVQAKDHCFYGGANRLSVNESRICFFLSRSNAADSLEKLKKECGDDTKRFAKEMIKLYCEITGEDNEQVRASVYGRKIP